MTHSQGPWSVVDTVSRKPHSMALVDTGNGSKCIDATASGISAAQSNANARLIAASPDLLACCVRALNESARVHPDFLAQLKAALAKVEGT